MNHYRAKIAYSGTLFCGFKRTKMGPNIQEELQRCLEQILRHPVIVEGASLTDSGVHAEGQVIFFSSFRKLCCKKLLASFRGLLPKSIVPIDVECVPSSFHPSLDATYKEYHYSICNLPSQLPFYREFSWHIPIPLDQVKMEEAIPFLTGKWDFSAFSNQYYDNPERHVMHIALLEEQKGRLRIEIKGDRFLYRMVRILVGTLAWVGMGRISCNEITSIIESRDRKRAGPTAPAHGLTLKRVYYQEAIH